MGAMKAGTTSLYSTLKEHRAFSLPEQKELNFFNEPLRDERIQSYTELFPGDGLNGDFSPLYTFGPPDPDIPKRIMAMNPGARLIYILRDPIRRLQSHLRHDMIKDRMKGSEKELANLPFREDYLSTSDYTAHINNILTVFPEDQLMIVQFERLIEESRTVLQEIFHFLGLDALAVPETLHKKNVSSRRVRIYKASVLEKRFEGTRLWDLYKKFFYTFGRTVSRPELTDRVAKRYAEELNLDLCLLREKYDIDLDRWTDYNRTLMSDASNDHS